MNDALERLLSRTVGSRWSGSGATAALAALGGLGVGAALTYWLDPQRGNRRRALARDKAAHALRMQQRMLERGARDLAHRARGVGPRLSHLRSDDPSDEVLLARVRSELGRHTSHAHAITVAAEDGEITLEGPILADELEDVLRAVRRVRGVRRVHDELDVHPEPGDVPGLQGQGSVPRPVWRRAEWPPALRLVSMGAGLAGVGYGLARGGLVGAAFGVAGTLAALRGIANAPVLELVGVTREAHAVLVQKSITVHRPIDEVFAFWSSLDNLPRFMEHVLEVERGEDGSRSRWRLRGPAGTTWTWEAETTELEPNERIAWRTVDGSELEHEGSVRFEAVSSEETRVHVRLRYEPPAGALGHAIAALLGRDPKRALERDLLRMQSLLEQGVAQEQEPVASAPATQASVH